MKIIYTQNGPDDMDAELVEVHPFKNDAERDLELVAMRNDEFTNDANIW